MRLIAISSFALLAASSVLAAPMQARSDDFADIAGGGPPNGSPPPNISDAAIIDFHAVNFLENLEAAFFEEGFKNLTSWNKDRGLDYTIEVVKKVHAQEVIHIQTAEAILNHFKKPTFKPCKYRFPVNNADEFLKLANIITSVGIGGVINIISGLAESDPGLVQGPASILAIEARHDAFFREKGLNLVPNPAPFDTRISAAYALNLANAFIVPDSCKATPHFPLIPALTAEVKGSLTISGGSITFCFDSAKVAKSYGSAPLYIGWVNQANVVKYTLAKPAGDGKVETIMPDGMAGVAFAALTSQKDALDVNALTAKTLAGPAPVQIS